MTFGEWLAGMAVRPEWRHPGTVAVQLAQKAWRASEKAATAAERERCVEVGMNVKDRFVNEADCPAAAAAREVVEAIKALNDE
jgi:hypothetical protein